MTEKELRKLNRYELLEMLLAQGKKLERLERELAEANERLAQRQQIVATSGTMAEAAMRLNRVFEAADSAAKEYLSNMELIANSLLDDARRKAARIIEDTESPAVFMHFSTIKVWVNGTELTKGWVEGVDETSDTSHAIGSSATPATSKDDADWYVENADNTDSKFSIHINWLKSDGAFKFDNNGKPNVIKITYEGVLKSKGVVYGDNGNLNTATLFVLPNGSTTRAQVGNPSETKAVTYSGELFKYTTENGVKKPLAGAEFTIMRAGETAPLAFYPSKAYAGVYYLATDENWNSEHVDHSDPSKKESMKVTTLVAPTDGMIITRGLAGGEYTITETKAPDGYNKLTASIKMPLEQGGNPTAGVNVTDVNKTLAADGSPLPTPVAFQNVHVKEIENNKGTVLPETGGIGTTLFITLGALAVIGTGLFLVTNKRISKENF